MSLSSIAANVPLTRAHTATSPAAPLTARASRSRDTDGDEAQATASTTPTPARSSLTIGKLLNTLV